jgi:hypothetical protein
MTFKVQKKLCKTCIYRKDSTLNLEALEAEVADNYGGFDGYRVCHHTDDKDGVCCRGFWNKHKDKFAMGQIAQRLDLVEEVDIDNWEEVDEEVNG